MQYQGDLYAKIGRKYLKLEMTSDDVDNMSKRIKELEEENAEYESEAQEVNFRADKYIKRTVPKLAKAREIIMSMLPYMPKENIEGVYEIVTSAEEFLKNED